MWAGCSSIIIGLQAAGGRGNVWVGRRDPSTRSEGRLVLGCCDNQAAITPVDRGVIGAQWETVRLVRSGGSATPGEGCEDGQREQGTCSEETDSYSHRKDKQFWTGQVKTWLITRRRRLSREQPIHCRVGTAPAKGITCQQTSTSTRPPHHPTHHHNTIEQLLQYSISSLAP